MPKNKTQKVLIPKGTINPDEDTLIEIPVEFKQSAVVVAKRHDSHDQEVVLEKQPKNVEFDEDHCSLNGSRSKIRYNNGPNEENFNPNFHSSLARLDDAPCSSSNSDAAVLDRSQPCARSSTSSFKSSKSQPAYPPPSSIPLSRQMKRYESVSVSFGTSTSFDDSFKSDQQPSATRLNRPYSDSSPLPFEDKDTQSTGSTSFSKACCKKCFDKSDLLETTSEKEVSSRKFDRVKQLYKSRDDDIGDMYIEQLKRQFQEAKRNLDAAVELASMSLKQLQSNNQPRCKLRESNASICDSVPERDISFVPPARLSAIPACLPGSKKSSDLDTDKSLSSTSAAKIQMARRGNSDSSSCRLKCEPDIDSHHPFLKSSTAKMPGRDILSVPPARPDSLPAGLPGPKRISNPDTDSFLSSTSGANIQMSRKRNSDLPVSRLQYEPDFDSPHPFLKSPTANMHGRSGIKMSKETETQTDFSVLPTGSAPMSKFVMSQKIVEKKSPKCSSTCCEVEKKNSMKVVTTSSSNFNEKDFFAKRK